LDKLHGAISACLRCNGCTYGPWPQNYEFCPLQQPEKAFTYSAGGLLYLAKAVLRGQYEYSQALADLAFTCTACGACDSKCVIVRSINPDMALSDILRLLRYELVKRGLVPEGPIKTIYEDVKKNGDLLGNGQAGKLRVPAEIEDDKADTVFVADCLHSESHVGAYETALALLRKMKKAVALYSDPGCCGSTLYDFGFWDQLPQLVGKKWERIKELGQKSLLFIDPHCQEFMVNKYAKILDDFKGFRGQHFSELVLEAFNKGELKTKKGKKVKVSYHDPCFLGRGLGIYDAPRQVLARLDGVELVEMKRNREQSFCCGARGFGNYFENFSARTARERINEFAETKADLLITACPYCHRIFRAAMANGASRVKDLFEFVNERVA
jgi:Fe-S oxidoreductase